MRQLAWLVGVVIASGSAHGQIMRDDFSKGVETPIGWTLRDGAGAWEAPAGGRRTISVSGTGDDQSYWARAIPQLKPGRAYTIRFRAKADPGSTPYTLISGLDVCNRDFAVSSTWLNYSFAFQTPSNLEGAFLRLGQWHLRGRIVFSDVALYEVTPVYRTVQGITLGTGEAVRDGAYTFTAPLFQFGSNHSRCLVRHTAPFNSNRWVFTGGSEVVYRHAVGPLQQLGGSVSINVNYRTGGECIVYASRDDTTWIEVGRTAEMGSRTFDLPGSLFPADQILIRVVGASASELAGNSAPGAFQIDNYTYRATLRPDTPEAYGSTSYVETIRTTPGLSVDIEDMGDLAAGDASAVRVRLTADRAAAGDIAVVVAIEGEARSGKPLMFSNNVRLAAGRPQSVTVPYSCRLTGQVRLTISALKLGGKSPATLFAASTDAFIPAYYASDYGHSLTPVPDGELWWCESTYKVPPHRLPPPQQFGADLADLKAVRGKGAVSMTAARREREHAQLVFRPSEDAGDIDVSVSDLRRTSSGSPGRIPAANVEVREVAYLHVAQPTDRTGVVGEWPDPLPPLNGPWRSRVGRNNALWLTVTVPADAPAGDYVGTLTLAARRWKREIEVKLRVWDFALPERTALRSGFGVQPGSITRYHNLKTPGALEKVWDMYMEAFRKRRINPYNPMALAPYRLELSGHRWIGGTRDAEQAGSGQRSLRIADNDPGTSVSAQYADLVPVVPGTRYVLAWKCRTERDGQAYMVTVGHYDSNRQWMWGRNNDIVQTGTGQWDAVAVEITDRIPPDARYVGITLRPTVWTDKGENTGTAWFDDIELRPLDGGDSLLTDGDFEAEPRTDLKIDFTEFDKAAKRYLDGMGFNAFTISIDGLPGGRHPNFSRGSFMGYAPDTPEYDALMMRYGKLLQDHLEQNGWLDKAYVYWYDEPEDADYPVVLEGSARLKRYFPKIKRMLTEQFEEPLFGSVDLWCPITPEYREDRARARQKLGEEVWWYVCTCPKEPYCTLFIDHPAIELRMWLWQTWQRGIQGILIWETTWWTSPAQFPGDRVQNPWEDPMAYVADTTGVWGNGDGRFFYPPNRDPNGDRTTEYVSGPVDSIRWEMLGEGIEDWEYFRLLDAAIRRAARAGSKAADLARARALLQVPPAITSNLTTFTKDPQLLYRHRAAIAAEIERLGKVK
ncbi:MAG: DUF4091 domain-containing protein [Chthonomonadales bacterium]|nr:DUF4091 domain-containing protein [Chthonomonadales bacterium]